MPDRDRLTEAIQWRIRLRESRAEDWEAFILWLEADPDCSEAYDLVASADIGLDEAAVPAASDSPAPANDDWAEPRERRLPGRAAAGLAALAAMLLIGLLSVPWLTAGSSLYAVTTAPGEQRVVKLADGSGSVALNGATWIVLDRDDPRFAELVTGEAAFTVRHDPARPFTVKAGAHRLRDLGTVFNLVHEAESLSIEVAEGSILFDPRGAALTVGAGETLAVRGAGGPIVRDRTAPDMVAGWRRGQLSYKHAPLAAVARGLSRSIGMDIAVDSAIAERPFTGTIRVDRDRSRTMARLAAALGLQARRTGAGWTIEPSRRAPR